jgi:hypothetical protein
VPAGQRDDVKASVRRLHQRDFIGAGASDHARRDGREDRGTGHVYSARAQGCRPRAVARSEYAAIVTRAPEALVNFARRQQYRRLLRAGEAAAGSTIVALLGVMGARLGAPNLAAALLLAAIALGLCSRHWISLARRSAVGAHSEDAVQHALTPLEAEGWRLRHSLRWAGRGDIDSVAIAPAGIAVAIETKTRSYDRPHLARVHLQAGWLSRRRRRWARNGALAVMCLVHARSVERVEDDVLVVSIDRLTSVLRIAAAMASARAH